MTRFSIPDDVDLEALGFDGEDPGCMPTRPMRKLLAMPTVTDRKRVLSDIQSKVLETLDDEREARVVGWYNNGHTSSLANEGPIVDFGRGQRRWVSRNGRLLRISS